MNIFIVDSDPVIAANYLSDKHVVKMISESCQLLSTSHNICGKAVTPLKPTHINHPCVKWILKSNSNYEWLYQHFVALLNEFNNRYLHDHEYDQYIEAVSEPSEYIPDLGITQFVQAMPVKYRQNDAVQAYRDYYCNEKLHFCRWTEPSKVPYWIRDFVEKRKLRYVTAIRT